MAANWQGLATAEAQAQGVDVNIVLATVEAETGGNNVLGDSGNALGFGQVWPKWHMDAFQYAANKYRLTVPNSLSGKQQMVLGNDGVSMAIAVFVIKKMWNAAGKDFRDFSLRYVGPAIPDSDYQRRYKIWLKYQGGNYPSGSTSAGAPAFGGSGQSAAPASNQFDITLPASNYGVVAQSQKFGNVLYGRRYRVLVSSANGAALDVSQLRCTFQVQKTILQPPNFSEVIIYNLAPNTENSVIQEGNRIVIEAGYEGEQYGLIFDGDIVQPIRDKEDGVTYRLTLRSLDGDRFMNQGIVAFSVIKGQSSRSVIDNLASQAKVPAELGSISDGIDDVQLTRGKVVFGLAKDYFRQLAQTHDATFYMEDGKVSIIRAADLPIGEIFELSPASGLIGVPAQSEFGVSFKCLLNPRIKLGSLVHIDNSLVRAQAFQLGQPIRNLDQDGVYRVIGVTHKGDTRGDNWYTECETVSQAGAIISMMSSPTANPY